MGYFDGLISGNFKTTQDGRALYYPWGYWGRGYAVSEDDYTRLRRRLKIYHAVSLTLIIATAATQHFIALFVLGAALIAFYALWSRHLTAGLQATDERLSLHESMVSQARAYDAITLWLLELTAVALAATAIVLLFVKTAAWPMELSGIVFFGLCAAVFGYLIRLCRRATLSLS